MNFPRNHPLYVGNHWSEGLKDSPLETADVVLVIDCDVPWLKAVFKPAVEASIFHIDCDPIKVNMSLFHIDTELSCQANSKVAIQQLKSFLTEIVGGKDLNPLLAPLEERRQSVKERHDKYMASTFDKEGVPESDAIITPHYALSRLRSLLDDDCIILSEGISNYRPIVDVLNHSTPGTYFTSGATALGWHGGAAIGAKLAQPSKTIISITGDGSFLFSIPSTVHWMARKYEAPFLTIILNNRGWKSPMLSAMAVHKDGYSSKVTSDQLNVTFDPPCDHAQIAVAAGAGFGVTVKKASEIDAALKEAFETVRGGRAAVVDIWLPKFEVGDRVG
jgi:acetolactate synthase-1/2/3 large subunit